MTKRVKLTKAQRALLDGIAVEPTVVGLGYKPAAKLVELGFAVAIPRRLGAPRLLITLAGRTYLAEITTGASDNLKGETA